MIARLVAIGIGQYAHDENMEMLQPSGMLKAGFTDFSEDTAKDAARLICANIPPSSPETQEQVASEVVRDDVPTPTNQNDAATFCRESSEDFYRFNVTTIQDSMTFTLGSRYRFTVVLVVNVATYDGMKS